MNHRWSLRALVAALALCSCGTPSTPDGGTAPCVPGGASLDEIFTGSLKSNCLACHGTGTGQAGLFFTDAPSFYAATVNVKSSSDPKSLRISPGHPESSHVFFRLSPGAGALRMPQGGPYLDAVALEAISGWICAGAPNAPAVDGGVDAGVDAGIDAGVPDAGLSLIGFSPQAGVVGTRVTLTGTGFSTTPSEDVVTFAGVTAAVVSATGTSLQADVPAAAGSGSIQLTVFGHTVTSTLQFTVVAGTPVPVLSSVTPSSLAVGSPTQTLTLDGQGFIASSVARLDGSVLPTTFVSATRLTAQVDAAVFAQAGTHQVTVTTTAPDGGTGGGTSSAVTLTVQNPAPTITTLTPSTVASGGAAFLLSVVGTGFVASSSVELDGSAVATTFTSSTALSAQMPSFATAGTHDLTVRNPGPGGGLSTAATLTVQSLPQPSISTLSPNPGPAGQSFTLVITGANFTCAGAGPVVVFDGGVFAPTACAATTLSANLPATPPGTSDVQVRNPNNDVSTGVALTLVAPNPLPSLTTLVPSQVNAGSGAQTLSVQGSGFVAASTVKVDGVARSTTFVNAGELTASLLAADVATAGMRNLTVSTPGPGGGTSMAVPLTVLFVNPTPSLTTLTPSTLVTGSGATVVAIDGGGFVATSAATFNGSARATTFVSSTQLTVNLLAGDFATSGTFPLVVTNPSPGGGASNSLSLSVGNPVPAITSLSPCGVVAGLGGFTLTINGTGFLATTTLTFAGSQLTPTFVNSTRLTAIVAAPLVATAPASRAALVVATNPAPAGGASAAFAFGLASQVRSLATHVQPIFTTVCAGCHAATFPSGGLDLTDGAAAGHLVGIASAGCPSLTRVTACGALPSQSLLIDKLQAGQPGGLPPSCGGPMPAFGSITPAEFDSIVDWVAQGAPP